MAHLIKIKNAREGFIDVLKYLFEHGKIQASRNGNTIELEDVAIQIDSVVEVMDPTVRKGYNVGIGYVEGIQLLAGVSDAAFTAQVQPNFRNYMEEDTGKFWGAYGPRVVDQLPIIVERLRNDPDTRQAVVTLWDPKFDAHGGKKDHPCTNRFSFRIRGGLLNMTVEMRSNDAWWGFPYDVVQFAMLHHTMAKVLGVGIGTYVHKADSFHLYEPHWNAATEAIKNVANIAHSDNHYPVPALTGDTWEDVQDRAKVVYRVASQTLPATHIKTKDEAHIAWVLLELRAKRTASAIDQFKDSLG